MFRLSNLLSPISRNNRVINQGRLALVVTLIQLSHRALLILDLLSLGNKLSLAIPTRIDAQIASLRLWSLRWETWRSDTIIQETLKERRLICKTILPDFWRTTEY